MATKAMLHKQLENSCFLSYWKLILVFCLLVFDGHPVRWLIHVKKFWLSIVQNQSFSRGWSQSMRQIYETNKYKNKRFRAVISGPQIGHWFNISISIPAPNAWIIKHDMNLNWYRHLEHLINTSISNGYMKSRDEIFHITDQQTPLKYTVKSWSFPILFCLSCPLYLEDSKLFYSILSSVLPIYS